MPQGVDVQVSVPVRQCSAAPCEGDLYAKGFCSRHYAAMKYRSSEYATGRYAPCATCGEPCAGGRGSLEPGVRRHRACGGTRRPGPVKPKPPRPCVRCGKDCGDRPRVKFCVPCGVARTAERYRDKCRRRRATVRGLPSEPCTTEEIAARDDFTCGICSLPVDMTLKAPDFGSPSIDHKIPIVAGGADTKANVQLAHLNCNARKGCSLEVAA
jgi:hypothetical protein